MNPRLLTCILLLFTVITACTGSDSDTNDGVDQVADNHFTFSVTVTDIENNPLYPAGIYLYDAGEETGRAPLLTFSGTEKGVIEGNAEKGHPYIIRINSAGHFPLYLFIPSYFEDELIAKIVPVPVHLGESVNPAIIGNFNHFDRFSAVEMQRLDDGLWIADIDAVTDTIRYLITGVEPRFSIHGTEGELQTSDLHTSNEQGIESVIIREEPGPVSITFNPSLFRDDADGNYSIRFDESTPLRTAAAAKSYAAMMNQARKIDSLRKHGESIDAIHFRSFLTRLETIAGSFEHEDTGLAVKIAKSRFADYLNPDEDWADNLLDSVQPGSDLWLMNETAIGDLFSISSRMESVSQNLWNIYRQNRSGTIQGEALYNLLSFHYERGEDEEWYQAHFDLVRNYPGHPRINESYSKGYAPESVVFVGRYFPDLSFKSAGRTTEYTPAEYEANLSILFFWSPDDEQSLDQIGRLKSLHNRFAGRGLTVTAIALYPDAERIERFHSHHNLPWETAAETLRSPAVQVIGITSVPHTIVLDAANRVLINNDTFLNDDRIEEMVEEYFQSR